MKVNGELPVLDIVNVDVKPVLPVPRVIPPRSTWIGRTVRNAAESTTVPNMLTVVSEAYLATVPIPM